MEKLINLLNLSGDTGGERESGKESKLHYCDLLERERLTSRQTERK